MASFHSSTSSVSRSSGGSSTAKGAYISGSCITDGRTGEVHDYEKKQGVEHTEIILPKEIADEIKDKEQQNQPTDKEVSKEEKDKLTPEKLWNKAEQAENRKDARVAREWAVGLPHELTAEQRKELARELGQEISNRYQVATQISLHEPSKQGDNRNYHVHILSTTRKIDRDLNLTDKADIELSNKKCLALGIKTTDEQIKDVREMISDKINLHLERANINEKVTHLSYKDQGLDRIPTKHMGKEITQLERQGVKTELGDYNRHARKYNELKTSLEAIFKQPGMERYQPPLQNATNSVKNSLENELSATERAKIYLEKRAQEKITGKVVNNEEPKSLTEERRAQLLNEILSKRSYDQIIDRQKKEQEKKLEQEQAQKQEYQKINKRSFGFER